MCRLVIFHCMIFSDLCTDSTDIQVVLTVYPLIATAAELLYELKSCFMQTTRDHEHAHVVRPRCVDFVPCPCEI